MSEWCTNTQCNASMAIGGAAMAVLHPFRCYMLAITNTTANYFWNIRNIGTLQICNSVLQCGYH